MLTLRGLKDKGIINIDPEAIEKDREYLWGFDLYKADIKPYNEIKRDKPLSNPVIVLNQLILIDGGGYVCDLEPSRECRLLCLIHVTARWARSIMVEKKELELYKFIPNHYPTINEKARKLQYYEEMGIPMKLKALTEIRLFVLKEIHETKQEKGYER